MATKQETQKINEALELLNEAARDKKDDLTKTVSDKYGDLKNALLEMESDIAGTAHQGARRLEELKEAAAQRARETARQVDQKAHEDPWKALGWSVAGAFVVGFLLGRKD